MIWQQTESKSNYLSFDCARLNGTMDEQKLPSPHNRFFHFSFSNIEVTRDFLKSQLAPEDLACLDLSTLKLYPGSFIDDELRESQSDLIFSIEPMPVLLATTSEASPLILIYVLLEHKSYPDPMTPFQVLKYIVRILEQGLREKKPLSCVIPMVVYHGETAWTVARSLDDLLDVPKVLKRNMPQFTPPLLDLSQIPEDQKFANPFLQAVMQTLRYIWSERLRSNLQELVDLFKEITQDGRDADPLKAFLAYIISASPKLDRQELSHIIQQSFPTQGPAIMSTIAEQYFLEGRDQGIEKGEFIGTIRTCQSILNESDFSEEALRSKSIDELRKIAHDLQNTLRDRFGTT